MNLKYSVLLASGLLVGSAVAYSASSPDRRTFLSQSITGAIAAGTGSSLGFLSKPSSTMAATDDEGNTATSDDGFITTESGLRYKVVTVGNGAIPSPGQTVKAHYTGMYSSSFVLLGFFSTIYTPVHFIKQSQPNIFCFDVNISHQQRSSKKVGWMDSILPKSLIRVGIVVVPFNSPLAKDKSFGYVCDPMLAYIYIS